MRICFIIASRQRFEKFFDTLDNIRRFATGKNHFIVASLDEDDKLMNAGVVKHRLDKYPELTVRWGLSKSKIHAINRATIDLPSFDILVNVSDDQRFTV